MPSPTAPPWCIAPTVRRPSRRCPARLDSETMISTPPANLLAGGVFCSANLPPADPPLRPTCRSDPSWGKFPTCPGLGKLQTCPTALASYKLAPRPWQVTNLPASPGKLQTCPTPRLLDASFRCGYAGSRPLSQPPQERVTSDERPGV